MKRKRSSLKTPHQIVSTDLYLDDYCWENIIKFVFNNDEDDNRRNFKSLSVVNKRFLSITNRLRFSLTVWKPTRSLFSRLFQRFPNLISLDISCYYGNVNNLLVRISRFSLKLTSLNLSNQPTIPARGLRAFSRNITTVTSLICSNIASLSTTDLVVISDCFPFLEELDLSNSINFKLDHSTSMVLPKLRKVNLSGCISSYITDSWLLHFLKNSEFLEDVAMLKGSLSILINPFTASAIPAIPTLKSLAISYGRISSHFIDSILSMKNLTCLDLSRMRISDEFLSSIAMRGLPLRKLFLSYCHGYCYDGIFCLLSKCQCIQYLNLEGADLNDQHVNQLSLFFGHLLSINLSNCTMLTESALSSLVKNGPLLGEIKLDHTSIGSWSKDVVNSISFEDFVVRPRLKSLHLAYNYSQLRDERIEMFASIFPNLERLDLRGCFDISGKGIYQVLRRCCKIRDLNLQDCSGVKLLREVNFEVPTLKVLNLSYTSVDDETLNVISKSCYELLQLVLEGCDGVTKEGIRHVVKNCTQLREINLKYCDKLHPNIVDKMVFSRPSLRKITVSPNEKFNGKKKKLFSNYGCLLCPDKF